MGVLCTRGKEHSHATDMEGEPKSHNEPMLLAIPFQFLEQPAPFRKSRKFCLGSKNQNCFNAFRSGLFPQLFGAIRRNT